MTDTVSSTGATPDITGGTGTTPPSVEAFRAEALDFLEANASRKETQRRFVWGEGSDEVALFDEESRERELEVLRRAQAWRATKFDAGFGWITGPPEYGGHALSHAH